MAAERRLFHLLVLILSTNKLRKHCPMADVTVSSIDVCLHRNIVAFILAASIHVVVSNSVHVQLIRFGQWCGQEVHSKEFALECSLLL